MNCKEIIYEHWISDKTIWWPIYWKFIILNIFNLKDNEKENLYWISLMLKSIQYIIPCEECRKHYIENLHSHKMDNWYNKEAIKDLIEFTYNNIERSHVRKDDWDRDKLVDKYLWEEIAKNIPICNW